MPLIHPKPFQVDGLVDGAAVFDAGKVVDAKLLSDNWQEIYTAINQGLHGNNFEYQYPQTFVPILRDDQIQYPEFGTIPGTTPGMTHSHDGVDSARLGPQSINLTVTRYRPFGAFMHPSYAPHTTLHVGRVYMDIRSVTGDYGEEFAGHVPIDSISVGQPTDVRAVLTTEVHDHRLKGQIHLVTAAATVGQSDSRYYLTVTASVYWKTTPGALGSIDGFYIHGLVFFYGAGA